MLDKGLYPDNLHEPGEDNSWIDITREALKDVPEATYNLTPETREGQARSYARDAAKWGLENIPESRHDALKKYFRDNSNNIGLFFAEVVVVSDKPEGIKLDLIKTIVSQLQINFPTGVRFLRSENPSREELIQAAMLMGQVYQLFPNQSEVSLLERIESILKQRDSHDLIIRADNAPSGEDYWEPFLAKLKSTDHSERLTSGSLGTVFDERYESRTITQNKQGSYLDPTEIDQHLPPKLIESIDVDAGVEFVGYGSICKVYGINYKDRRCVVKVLNREYMSKTGASVQHAISEFNEEAENLRKLRNVTGIPRLVGMDYQSEEPYIIMERVDGENLREIAENTPYLGFMDSISIYKQLLNIAAGVHKANLFQIDLQAQDIYLNKPKQGVEPEVAIVDWNVLRNFNIDSEEDVVKELISQSPNLKEGQFTPQQLSIRRISQYLLQVNGLDLEINTDTLLRNIRDNTLPASMRYILTRAIANIPEERLDDEEEILSFIGFYENLIGSSPDQLEDATRELVSNLGENTISNHRDFQKLKLIHLVALDYDSSGKQELKDVITMLNDITYGATDFEMYKAIVAVKDGNLEIAAEYLEASDKLSYGIKNLILGEVIKLLKEEEIDKELVDYLIDIGITRTGAKKFEGELKDLEPYNIVEFINIAWLINEKYQEYQQINSTDIEKRREFLTEIRAIGIDKFPKLRQFFKIDHLEMQTEGEYAFETVYQKIEEFFNEHSNPFDIISDLYELYRYPDTEMKALVEDYIHKIFPDSVNQERFIFEFLQIYERLLYTDFDRMMKSIDDDIPELCRAVPNNQELLENLRKRMLEKQSRGGVYTYAVNGMFSQVEKSAGDEDGEYIKFLRSMNFDSEGTKGITALLKHMYEGNYATALLNYYNLLDSEVEISPERKKTIEAYLNFMRTSKVFKSETDSNSNTNRVTLKDRIDDNFRGRIKSLTSINFSNSEVYIESATPDEITEFSEILNITEEIERKLHAQYPDEKYRVLPHTGTLSGEGSVFIAMNKEGSVIYVKADPDLISSRRMSKERAGALDFLKSSFAYQMGEVNKDYGSAGNNANAISEIITLGTGKSPNAIILEPLIDLGSVYKLLELIVDETERIEIVKGTTKQFLGVLDYFLERYREGGTLPEDWGFKHTQIIGYEFKGVGFFADDLVEGEFKIGVYDIGENDSKYLKAFKKKDFLRNILGFVVTLTNKSELLPVVSGINNGSGAIHNMDSDYTEEVRQDALEKQKEFILILDQHFAKYGMSGLAQTVFDSMSGIGNESDRAKIYEELTNALNGIKQNIHS